MTNLVNPSEIEWIVGVNRHEYLHYILLDSATGIAYILHSHRCVDTCPDLRDCEYSLALEKGLEWEYWHNHQDRPVAVGVFDE